MNSSELASFLQLNVVAVTFCHAALSEYQGIGEKYDKV